MGLLVTFIKNTTNNIRQKAIAIELKKDTKIIIKLLTLTTLSPLKNLTYFTADVTCHVIM